MSALSTSPTRGETSATTSTARFTTAITSSHSPSTVVNIEVSSQGSPDSLTTRTAAATASETEPSALVAVGEMLKATSILPTYARAVAPWPGDPRLPHADLLRRPGRDPGLLPGRARLPERRGGTGRRWLARLPDRAQRARRPSDLRRGLLLTAPPRDQLHRRRPPDHDGRAAREGRRVQLRPGRPRLRHRGDGHGAGRGRRAAVPAAARDRVRALGGAGGRRPPRPGPPGREAEGH